MKSRLPVVYPDTPETGGNDRLQGGNNEGRKTTTGVENVDSAVRGGSVSSLWEARDTRA